MWYPSFFSTSSTDPNKGSIFRNCRLFFYVILYFIPQKANTINTYHDEKAFNRVNWLKLLEVLKSIGVDWCDWWLIERRYKGQSPRVRLKDGLTDPAVIGHGTIQAGLKIMAGQQTMSGLIADLTGQTLILPVILTGHFWIQTYFFVASLHKKLLRKRTPQYINFLS